MSILSKLFGSSKSAAPVEAEAETYKDFTIEPRPDKDGSGYRIGALVSKVIDGDIKTHHLIRADVIGDLEEAKKASVAKAQVMIDQVGDGIFR